MHPLNSLKVPAGSMAIHWFEQSTYAIKGPGKAVIQIDPYFPRNRPADRFLHTIPPLDEMLLPTKYVLLTHDHSDHTCSESLQRIWRGSPDVRVIGPEESINRVLRETKVAPERTTTIFPGDKLELGSITAHVVYAKPLAGDPAANIDPPDVTHLGYVIDTDGPTLYFSGDPINTFAEHDDLLAPIAKLKPDIGFLTCHPTEGEFPFYDGCVKTAQKLGLKHVVPAHRACFVKRDYDPTEWAAQFPAGGPEPLIIERNTHVIYPG